MLTIVETPTFQRLWPDYWTEEERAEFAAWLALTPDAGDVVPGSGGVRVVYFNRLADGEIWLLLIYAKSVQDNIPAAILRELKQEIEDAHD